MSVSVDNVKRNISGFARTTGKFTLKGFGRGIELLGKGTKEKIEPLVRDPEIQKIATSTGIIVTGVTIPAVGVGLVGITGLKYLIDHRIKDNDKEFKDEISDIFKAGNVITKTISENILSPLLNIAGNELQKGGKALQSRADDLFI